MPAELRKTAFLPESSIMFLKFSPASFIFPVMSAKVYISYGEEDHSTAGRLYDDLKNSGFAPWMDKKSILGGRNWKLEIRQAIQESSFFLVLLSEKSLSGRGYFHKELKTALEVLDEMPPGKIFILPVRLDPCESAYEKLQDIQHTDLFPSYDEGFRQIVRALESPGDEKESRRFVSKSVLGKMAGIRVESGEDSAFATNSGKAGIVKDAQAGVVGDGAEVEGGIHQQTQNAEGAYGPVQAGNIGKLYQDARLWIVAVALVCLIPVLIIVTRPDIRQQSPNIKAGRNATVTYGIPPKEFEKLSKKLGFSKGVLESFFVILERKQPENPHTELIKIAEHYKELRKRLSLLIFDTPEIRKLKEKAEKALEKGDFDQAEKLLKEAADRTALCKKNLQDEYRKCSLSEAEIKASLGDLANTRLEYKKAAVHYKEAAEILEGIPDSELALAGYLQKQGDACCDAGLYAEAEKLLERSLEIRVKHLGNEHKDVATGQNNLAELYYFQGRYEEAEPLLKRALLTRDKIFGLEHPDFVDTLNNLANLYRAQGRYEEAEPFFISALTISEKVLGPEHPGTAAILNNLAEQYESQGKYKEAEPLFKRALTISEKALGPEHPSTAMSLNNLAGLYYSQGRYEEAELLFKRALMISEKVLGPEHPNVAGTLNNLAVLYLNQGRYEEAEHLFKRILAAIEKILVPEHPNVAGTLNNLATLYLNQGRYEEAELLYERALKVLGPEHPNTAVALNNLATLYESQNKYEKAEPLYKCALVIKEKALGTEHPDVATALNKLAVLYEFQGKYEEAEPLYNRVLEINEKVHGPEHPDVATALGNLGEMYFYQRKYEEANSLYKRALAISEKALGSEHPDLAIALNNLGERYYYQGKYEEAEPLYKRALVIKEKVMGSEHPDVATALNKLVALYRKQGKYKEAEPLCKRALAIKEKVGQEYPDVVIALGNLAELYYYQGKYEKAEPLFKRILAILEKALGAEHPNTVTVRKKLNRLLKTSRP